MQFRLPIYIAGAFLTAAMAACNSSSDPVETVTDDSGAYGAYVNSFKLEKNDSVLANLDTVFFSIDLDKGRIFNADSLPKGTDISKLVVRIGLPTVRQAMLIVPGADGAKSDTIDYLEHPSDTVCFSRGPVTLRVVSYNQLSTRDYEIRVNVHNEVSDTLFWNQTAQSTLPTSLRTVAAQGTAEIDGTTVCLTSDGTAYSRATSTDLYAGTWQTSSAALPAGARVEQLTAAGGVLYLTDSADRLYSSADLGATWTDTGDTMHQLLGANGSHLLGLRLDADGTYLYATYPASSTSAADPEFPVSGSSQCVQYVTEWAPDAMTVILGGTTAAGRPTGAAWAYDGTGWSAISNDPIPDLTGLTLVPYFTFRVSDAWVATKYTVLMAFGGMDGEGQMNRDTYISFDRGVNWTKGGSLLNLPADIRPFYGADAVVAPQTLTASRAATSAWTMLRQRSLPAWCEIASVSGSRATAPIEQWECPFIYLFGGYDADGHLSSDIWRGVINRLTFKPIQ